MNLVALELLANAIAPRKQCVDVGGIFQLEKKHRLLATDHFTGQNPLAQLGNSFRDLSYFGVNHFSTHG
jgi:hypothetical protein